MLHTISVTKKKHVAFFFLLYIEIFLNSSFILILSSTFYTNVFSQDQTHARSAAEVCI